MNVEWNYCKEEDYMVSWSLWAEVQYYIDAEDGWK